MSSWLAPDLSCDLGQALSPPRASVSPSVIYGPSWPCQADPAQCGFSPRRTRRSSPSGHGPRHIPGRSTTHLSPGAGQTFLVIWGGESQGSTLASRCDSTGLWKTEPNHLPSQIPFANFRGRQTRSSSRARGRGHTP